MTMPTTDAAVLPSPEVAQATAAKAMAAVEHAAGLLVIGSSLMAYSAASSTVN